MKGDGMKTLFCRDIGTRTCNFIAEGKSIEEAERVLIDHVQLRHPGYLDTITFEEKEKLLEHVEAMVEVK
jgi:predicted small metal-binding protein